MALGAAASDLRRMVLLEALRLAVVGAVLGIVGGLAVSRVLSGFLFQTTPADPVTFVVAPLVLAAAALLAGYLPARRATRIDPIVALR
jgi:ABC-type antimicrobial peptide transport system permease subunit